MAEDESFQRIVDVQELETALLELNTIKKNAKVYKQQPNSNLFFLSDVKTLKADIQKELNCLQLKDNCIKNPV